MSNSINQTKIPQRTPTSFPTQDRSHHFQNFPVNFFFSIDPLIILCVRKVNTVLRFLPVEYPIRISRFNRVYRSLSRGLTPAATLSSPPLSRWWEMVAPLDTRVATYATGHGDNDGIEWQWNASYTNVNAGTSVCALVIRGYSSFRGWAGVSGWRRNPHSMGRQLTPIVGWMLSAVFLARPASGPRLLFASWFDSAICGTTREGWWNFIADSNASRRPGGQGSVDPLWEYHGDWLLMVRIFLFIFLSCGRRGYFFRAV